MADIPIPQLPLPSHYSSRREASPFTMDKKKIHPPPLPPHWNRKGVKPNQYQLYD